MEGRFPLEGVLDLAARFERAAVVARATGPRRHSLSARQPLDRAPAVDEHDRRVVLRGRGRAARGRARARSTRPPRWRLVRRPPARPELVSSAGITMPRSSSLAHPGVDDAQPRGRPRRSARSPRAAAAWPTRDALRDPLASCGEPLERERQVRPALGRRDRVHLVDDHGLDAGQDLPRARREHQVEALRRRDEDVGRRAQHAPALLLRVSPVRTATRRRRQLTPGPRPSRGCRERYAQVALDVVVERLERRDVEHPQTLARLGHDAVEEPQERRERLARACRRAQQRVLARRDRRPAQRLRRRRRPERAVEPSPRMRREPFERLDGGGGHRLCTIRPRCSS